MSHDYLNTLINSMTCTVLIVDCNLNIKMANRAIARLLGYSPDSLIGKPYDMLCANREGHCENVKMHYEEGSIWDIETYFRTQDRKEIPVLLSASPVKVTNGDTGDILVVVKDNTDYRNALESLREERDRAQDYLKITKETEQTILESQQLLISEHEKLNELFKTVQQGKREWEKTMDCLGDLILITGEDGKIRRVNRTVSETFNMPYQEIIGKSWEEVLLEQGMESSTFYSGGVEIFQKAAGKWYVLNSYPFTSEDVGYSGTVITLHNTSELKLTTQKLEETTRKIEIDKEDLRKALDQISNLIQNVTLRKDYEAATFNPNLKKCYEVKGCTNKDCPCYGKEAARCWQIAGTFCGGKVQGAFAQKYGSCSKCNVFTEAMSDPIHQIGEQFNNMMHVIEMKNRETETAYAELKHTQAQLLQREKMASVGQLAAGVAHEINNPMGFISSNLGTLGKYINKLTEFMAAQSEITESLHSAEASGKLMELRKRLKLDYILADLEQLIMESLDGADRVKKIVQNLKSFSRVDEAEHKFANINECIESTLNIVWNELKYKATVTKEYGELPQTKCFPLQLNQVFVNLLINASQAIEKQGEIKIRTWNGDGSIKVSISDTGAGIAEDKIGRIFEPFFTTKEVGKGTGLGLSITYDIVKKHNGDISVESEVGKGTTFTVRIPVVEEK